MLMKMNCLLQVKDIYFKLDVDMNEVLTSGRRDKWYHVNCDYKHTMQSDDNPGSD